MNWSHRSAHVSTEPFGKFMSHDLAGGIRASGNQFAIILSFAPAATIVVVYTCKKSRGFEVPSYFTGTLGQNLAGHITWRSWLE
jgi:hypothetical protein